MISLRFPFSSVPLLFKVVAERVCLLLILVAWFGFNSGVFAQPARNDGRTINQRISPNWTTDTSFTFAERLPDGQVKTRVVDASTGKITTLQQPPNGSEQTVLRGGPPPRSQPSATETNIEFVNDSNERVQLFWIDMSGHQIQYGSLSPGKRRIQHTFAGHAWMVKSSEGKYYGSAIAQSPATTARIKQTFEVPGKVAKRDVRDKNEANATSDRRRSRDGRPPIERSPNGLRIRIEPDAENHWIDLEFGRDDGREVVSPTWSPDGSFVAAWKVRRHHPADAVTIESSPIGGGRAQVKRRPYRLPGDPYDEYELFVFDAKTGDRMGTELPRIDFGRPKVHWFGEHQLAIAKVDRGHQRVRLFVIDPKQSTTATIVDEQTETFIWTAHGPPVPAFTFLKKTDEVIYASECSGYRHLYLVDLNGGSGNSQGESSQGRVSKVKPDLQWREKAITSGDWLVREIVEIDEANRTVDLFVGEFFPDQDPYHRHLVRVAVDDGKTVAITESDGDHTMQYSPTGEYVIATHSRVDSSPVHELRRVADGTLVTELMRAKRICEDESPWTMPRVFQSPGRDGETAIWGNLYFPIDFDESKKKHYPVIEAIYAGPHDSHVPKRYLHSRRFEDLTSLGFIVVQIDGMGTANRSKAFHDRCWHNLKDAGFPDRIAWMKAAAKVYPAMDTSRVGIFGTSAGGQNACGALLFHGDFYKAAYASCGCHDNRMDKASWNEQWMGFPVRNHYATNSNIVNAHRLKGDLFIVVGELDSNVPPESTFRLVDALVKADKDFDFIMIPGMGHGDGGKYGRRRMREFFVEKLKP